MREMQQKQDREEPCRVRGCGNTWTWTARQQMLHDGDSPPRKMCQQCVETLRQLSPQDVPCRLRGCANTWHWPKSQQLEHVRKGGSVETPPKRLCPACVKALQQLEEREVPCKVEECSGTWTFSPFSQLQHEKLYGEEAEPPSRMCRQCSDYLANTRSKRIKCVMAGCKNTWTYTKSMQLHDWHLGRSQPEGKLCNECEQVLADLADRPEMCSVPGCEKTWTYTAWEQLKDRRLRRSSPQQRRCQRCENFLAEHHAIELTCRSCQGAFRWSAYEQLLHEFGTFDKPELCADCKEEKIRLQEQPAPSYEHHHVVRIPSHGEWNRHREIANWPPYVNSETVSKAEHAAIRILAFGDELTFSRNDCEEAWPALLEKALQEDCGEQAPVTVINSGMPGTNSRHGSLRYERDVRPFAPHLIIFSFVFGDALVDFDPHKGPKTAFIENGDAGRVVEDLYQSLSDAGAALLHWTPNPVFPHDTLPPDAGRAKRLWADKQAECLTKSAAYHQRLCHEKGIYTHDLRARFEINGHKSARKWMENWYRHNAVGASHIATWMRNVIAQEELLPARAEA